MTKPVSEMSEEEYDRHRQGRARRRTEKQIKLMEMFNYTCESCGLREETIGFFEFHHIDPKTKDREVGSMLNSASWEKVLEEVKKCKFLCPNCHKKEHLKEGMRIGELQNVITRKQ